MQLKNYDKCFFFIYCYYYFLLAFRTTLFPARNGKIFNNSKIGFPHSNNHNYLQEKKSNVHKLLMKRVILFYLFSKIKSRELK